MRTCWSVGLDRALNDRRTAVFDDLEAIAPKDGIVSLFRMRYDYHNAKTIVKAEAMGKDPSGLLLGGGRVDAQALKTAYETGEAGPAPQAVLEAMTAARDALSRSADPQLADLILDRAYFAEYHAAAAQVGSSFLMGYAALQADSANLRAAVRARRMQKDAGFLEGVLVPGGSVDPAEICRALGQDEPFAPLFAASAPLCRGTGGRRITDRLSDRVRAAVRRYAHGVFRKGLTVVFGEQVVIASSLRAGDRDRRGADDRERPADRAFLPIPSARGLRELYFERGALCIRSQFWANARASWALRLWGSPCSPWNPPKRRRRPSTA
ncbi:MAG: V-type ATPase subunit [Blautia wexlerae]